MKECMSDKEYEVEEDARTLMEYQELIKNKLRMKLAKEKLSKKMKEIKEVVGE